MEPQPIVNEICEHKRSITEEDFLAFVCRAINSTAPHKGRTARIKEVVKAAKDILGISESYRINYTSDAEPKFK